MAEAQEQWQQAYEYYMKSLEIDIEFENPDVDIMHRRLRRLWQTHPAENVLPTLAQALG